MSFGEKLREIRLSKNMSQEDLAVLLDVSRQSVSKWENDKVLPEIDKLILIAKEFHISIDNLLIDEVEAMSTSDLNSKENIWDASRKNNVLEIKRNLDEGAFVDEVAKNEDAATPLMIAITYGSLEAVKFLIQNHADINHQKNDGATPLYLAVFFGRIQCVRILLESNANPNIPSQDGLTAMDLLNLEWSSSLQYLYDFFNQKYDIGLCVDEIKSSRKEMQDIFSSYGYPYQERE